MSVTYAQGQGLHDQIHVCNPCTYIAIERDNKDNKSVYTHNIVREGTIPNVVLPSHFRFNSALS